MTLPVHGFTDWQIPLFTADLQTDVLSTDVNPAATFTTAVFDMRAYQSFSLMVSAVSNIVPKTGYGDIEYQVQWFANSFGSQIVYQRRYAFLPQGSTGGFATSLGRVMHKGPVMGPYMSITVLNNGPDQVSFTYRILGNTKTTTQDVLINTDVNGHGAFPNDQGMLVRTGSIPVGAGITFNFLMPMAYGPAGIFVQTGAQAFTVTVIDPTGTIIWQDGVPATTFRFTKISLPQASCQLTIQNTGAAAANIIASVVSERENW